MSRKTNEEPLNDVIGRLLKAYGLEDGYYAAAVVTHWEKMMGPAVSKRTKQVKIENGKLIIVLDSAALRHELSFAKEKIAARINKEIMPGLIKEVELR